MPGPGPSRRHRPAARRRRRLLTRFVPLLAIVGVLVGFGATAALGPGRPHGTAAARGHRAPTRQASLAAPTSTTAPTTTVAPTTTAAPTTTLDPGALPQTGMLPPSGGPQFTAEMGALWEGIVTGSLDAARPAFFPEAAYLQVKSLGNDRADYQDRLLADYARDLAAAHDLLPGPPASATLVEVQVPMQYAHWVPPGTCANRVGYFEVPNARVVYRAGGTVRSFGIASMISWRGVWYVVHLGAVVRSTSGGIVDDPATGPGASAPSSTC